MLAADGVFRADGVFVALPAIPAKLLERGFRSQVLKLLVAERAIGERLSASMLAWRHSGFSVHNGVRVASGDRGKATLCVGPVQEGLCKRLLTGVDREHLGEV